MRISRYLVLVLCLILSNPISIKAKEVEGYLGFGIDYDKLTTADYIIEDVVYDFDIDSDWSYYRIEIPKGSYDIKFYLSNNDKNYKLYLVDEELNLDKLYSNKSDKQNYTIIRNIHGETCLDIAVNNGTNFSYELNKEESSSKQEAKSLKVNKSVSGEISISDDIDYFKFKPRKTDVYSFSVKCISSPDTNYNMLNYNLFRYSDSVGLGRTSIIKLKCNKNKTYYLYLSSMSSCKYKISIKKG